VLAAAMTAFAMLVVLTFPDIPPDERARGVALSSVSLVEKGLLLLTGVLILSRSRHARVAVGAALLVAAGRSAWVYANIPAPEPIDPPDGSTEGQEVVVAVVRSVALLLIPGFCVLVLAYLLLPRTRAEFADGRGDPAEPRAAPDAGRQ
jgi:hypothetical protein